VEVLFDVAPAALAVYDASARRVRANDEALALLGRGAGPALRADGHAVAEKLVREVLRRGAAAFEDEVASSGDDAVQVRLHCHPIRGRGGEIAGVLLVGDGAGTGRLTALAMTDPLTGVLNQGAFRERLQAEVELAFRHGTPLAVALIDIDEFKVVNDTFGHLVGDRVLVDIVAIIAEHVRASDVLGRVGGDEFAILMPHSDADGAAIIAGRVHAEVGAASVGGGQRVTLSIGVCELGEGEGLDDLVARVDQALYTSKRHGRDMVWRYDARHDTLRGALPDVGQSGPLAGGQTAAAVRALARAIDLKDAATRQHSDRVAELAVRLAETSAWPPERCELMRQAAVVHDVGKVAVPDSILLKPGRLSDSEHVIIRMHAELGAQIASEIFTPEQTSWLRGHHERVDGTGYPDGLVGDEIPDGAKILAVADAYDVMTSDRPYAAARDPTEALKELRRCAGTQFANETVEAFHAPHFMRLAMIHSNQERSRAANAHRITVGDGYLELWCECANPACAARVRITPDELHGARTHQRRFVLVDGHELPDVERVVGRTPRFVIAEKRV
jgi:diguanylate cyclase (GGDEF)-like protein/putative nucleotidyltransferase with HDIG domain